ncbi:MAG: hypothetical protein ACFE7E_05620 [Candidatus Hodarchaeota archaeon]
MNRNTYILGTILISLVLTMSFAIPVYGNPGNVDIHGISIKTPCEIGETLTLTSSYTLEYNPPQETGYAILSIHTLDSFVAEKIFTEPGVNQLRSADFKIDPQSWDPGADGQTGVGNVTLVVEEENNTLVENAVVTFSVKRAGINCTCVNITSNHVSDHEEIEVIFEFFNEHDRALVIPNLIVQIQGYSDDEQVVNNTYFTDNSGKIPLTFYETDWSSSNYTFYFDVSETSDYESATLEYQVYVNNSNELSATLVPASVYAYAEYDPTSSAIDVYDSSNNSYTEMTWKTSFSGGMLYDNGSGAYQGTISAPNQIGTYPVILCAEKTNSTDYLLLFLSVMGRPTNTILSLNGNMTQGELVTIGIMVVDAISDNTVADTLAVDIYAFWNDEWYDVGSILVENGSASFAWSVPEDVPAGSIKLRAVLQESGTYLSSFTEVNAEVFEATASPNSDNSIWLLLPIISVSPLVVLLIRRKRRNGSSGVEIR